MREAVKKTVSMIDVVWRIQRDAEQLDTPERRAGLERRLAALSKRIADPSVANEYARELRQRAREHLWQHRSGSGAGSKRGAFVGTASGRSQDWRLREQVSMRGSKGKPLVLPPRPQAREELGRHSMTRQHGDAGLGREATILRALLNHPFLLDEMAEEIATVTLASASLADLRDGILALHAQKNPLDSAALTTHLTTLGHNDALGLIARAITYRSNRFTEAGAPEDQVRMELRDALAEQEKAVLKSALHAAELHQAKDGLTNETFAQIQDLQARLRAVDARVLGSATSSGEMTSGRIAEAGAPADGDFSG